MSFTTDVGRELVRAYLPLLDAVGSGYGFRQFLRDMGWKVDLAELTDDVVGDLPALQALVTALETGADIIESGEVDPIELAEAIEDIIDLLADPTSFDLSAVLDAAAGPLADPQFWIDLAARLPEYLIVRWSRTYHPVLHHVLRLAGIVVDAVGEELPPGVEAEFESIDLGQIGGLLGGTGLADAYGWGRASADFDHGRLVDALLGLAAKLGLPATPIPIPDTLIGSGQPWADAEDERLDRVRGLEVGVVEVVEGTPPNTAMADLALLFLPVPHPGPNPGDAVRALLTTVRASGDLDLRLPLIDDVVTLVVTAGGDATGAAGVELSPGGVELVNGNAAVDVGLALELGGGPSPWRLPKDGGPAIEVGQAIVDGAILTGNGPGLELGLELIDVAFVLTAGDGFLGSVLGAAEIEVPLDLDLGWSSERGFTVGGSTGLAKLIVLDRTIGPVTVLSLEVALGAGLDGDVALSVDTLLAGTIGPFTLGLDGLGLALAASPADDGRGSFGPIDLSLVSVPPTTVTFEIETEAVNGSGFVTHDPDEGRYAGGLALDILGSGLSAIVIVDTQIEGDPDGFALFASLGLTFPTPIPLAFGFTLNGVGGLLALNRTLDGDELALDLKTGAADSLLFPDDLLEDAGTVLDGLDRWMPVQTGTTVVGPVVEIGWGSPETIIAIQLGVVIALPDLIVALLGSVEMLLPEPEEPVLELRMDIYGEVDIPGGSVLVVASLYDSTLLGLYDLSGDVGFYLDTLGQPFFVLSVGGYHPAFTPPGHVPESVQDLRRLRAAIDLGDNVEVAATAYVAVTSNSFQFGGGVDVLASVDFLGTTYTAWGGFSVNLLLIFKPFKLVADATFGVGISVRGEDVLSADLAVHLEGPKPWYATGRAYFTFLGIKVNFEFDVGNRPGGEPREIHDVVDDVVEALRDASAWRAVDSGDSWSAGLIIGDDLPDGLWARPDQLIEVAQGIAPLNRTISAFGETVPSVDELSVSDVTIGAKQVADPAWVDDWFAPAQFDRLGDQARLSGPSFEEMTAGVRYGDDGVELTPNKDRDRELATIDRSPETDVARDYVSPVRSVGLGTSTRHVSGPRLSVGSTSYTIVRADDAELATDFLNEAGLATELRYSEAVAALGTEAGRDRTDLRIAPTHAATGGIR